MKDLEFLRGVRAIVEQGWTEGSNAKDAEYRACDALVDEAKCFCLYGAASRVAGSVNRGESRLKDLIDPMLRGEDIDDWNDEPGRTQQQVLDLLDNKIKELSQ